MSAVKNVSVTAVGLMLAASLAAGLATSLAAGPAGAQTAPDVTKGKAQFARCMACHSVDSAKPRGIGPNLAGVVGRAAGKQPGFKYTPVLASVKFAWTAEKLDAFIAKPRDIVPGTNMVFAGIADPAARKALIAYLQTTKK